MPSIAPTSFQFLGIEVNNLRIPELNSLVEKTITAQEKIVIAGHNLHSLYVLHHDEEMRIFYNQFVDYVHIDGMGIILLGRLLGHPLRRQDRVTYLDWINPFFELANSREWRIYYLGRRANICERVPEVLQEAWPNLKCLTACWNFPDDSGDSANECVLQAIREFQPKVLLVGMGNPRQERWILDHYDQLDANVILTCGAAMDYVVGALLRPPRWAGRLGVEWLFRLLSEPRHLWRRYLVEPWHILWLLLLELLEV